MPAPIDPRTISSSPLPSIDDSLSSPSSVVTTTHCSPDATATQQQANNSSVDTKRAAWIMRVQEGRDGEVYGTSQIASSAVVAATVKVAPKIDQAAGFRHNEISDAIVP